MNAWFLLFQAQGLNKCGRPNCHGSITLYDYRARYVTQLASEARLAYSRLAYTVVRNFGSTVLNFYEIIDSEL